MALPALTLTYRCPAGAGVNARRFVCLGNSDTEVRLATDANTAIVGVSEQVPGVAGQLVDVIHSGVAMIEAGGPVARSSALTSDGTGRAVVANPATGVNAWVGAVALETASAAGDFFRVLLTTHRMQGQ